MEIETWKFETINLAYRRVISENFSFLALLESESFLKKFHDFQKFWILNAQNMGVRAQSVKNAPKMVTLNVINGIFEHFP